MVGETLVIRVLNTRLADIQDDAVVLHDGHSGRDYKVSAQTILWAAGVRGSALGEILARLDGQSLPPFAYRDKGRLAVIGRNAAVAEMGRWRFSGFTAWLVWVFIHIYYLIGYDSKLLVLIQWAWNYFTRKRGARLIMGKDPIPRLKAD